MPLNFQFAFLGCGHNYFARVIRIGDNGIPQQGECITEMYGLPTALASNFDRTSYSKIFVFNLRGHDFLSHTGQWTGSNGKGGYLPTSPTSISELALLKPLRDKNEANGYDGSEMIISFGPHSSSFFADVTAESLKRYNWRNLPIGLEDEIQKNLDAKGYGNIYQVMMNGEKIDSKDFKVEGGWVILFGRGESFAFGGKLPPRLEGILRQAKEDQAAKRGALFGPKIDNSIHRIYLNHQNPDDYVLLFNDGRCYASLHEGFREKLKRVDTTWAAGNGIVGKFYFTSSCEWPESTRKQHNAEYYARRGMFHLSKGNTDLALKYLREASDESKRDPEIQKQFAMAIIAKRQEGPPDEILDDMIKYREMQASKGRPRPREVQDENTLFRDEYMWILDQNYPLRNLKQISTK
ncbi:hypothetical protein L207DRAFT_525915 [Hyaloscypha variabilis F]|uniref:Uncharacterized protein n=1 Tax=Hyaloscypha variabilis (strain UAMH 11265 / GT02V1 / F) TaxID=1149755 RepID=A0A2J6S1H2_HYAVF|nr:hypothetical protein L207DRAFT_525915 [Hyaloscypha variabilis F]